EKSKNASHLCHLKRSDLHMSYAVCRMQKVKSAGLKGMQFHNQRERESRTNEDIDRERTHENYDLQNDENINYNERDRKSTRLNSSHVSISYAVFCLQKKKREKK